MNNRKIMAGLWSLLLIVMSLGRGSEQLFAYSHPLIDKYLYSLHISPKFRPFTKNGAYENTQNITHVYIKKPDLGYIEIDPRITAKNIGGGHAAKVVIYAGVIELPTKIVQDHKEAAFAVIRRLYCTPQVESIKIDVLGRYSGQLNFSYDIPCT